MMGRKRSDSFGTFLEQVKRYDVGSKGSDESLGNAILKILLSRGSLPVSDLMKESKLDFARFTDALKSVQVAGFVSLRDEASGEVASLTEKGEQIARLAN